MSTADVVIAGGGIHGCSAALALARRGLKVTVIERDHVGRHASGANAGGVRTLLRHPAEVPLALAAREIWHDIEREIGSDCGYHTVGQVAVAETDAGLKTLDTRHALMRSLGYAHEERIDAREVRRLLPAIAPGIRGGLMVREDGAASPFHATLAYGAAAVGAGVRFEEGVAVEALERTTSGWRVRAGGEVHDCGAVVNTAGAWGDRIAAMAGEAIPLGFFAPMMMVTARVEPFLDPVVIGTERPLSFKQMPNGTLLIGGGRPAVADRDAQVYHMDFKGMLASAQTVRDLFPVLRDVPIVRGWAGFEGRFVDDIPVIGASAVAPRLVHAFGFCGHGFQLSAIVGRLVADLVIDGNASLSIEAFAPDRFAMATEVRHAS